MNLHKNLFVCTPYTIPCDFRIYEWINIITSLTTNISHINFQAFLIASLTLLIIFLFLIMNKLKEKIQISRLEI